MGFRCSDSECSDTEAKGPECLSPKTESSVLDSHPLEESASAQLDLMDGERAAVPGSMG